MCYCYNHKCEKCDVFIPMHLDGFNTAHEEIEVYCPDHTPEDRTAGCLWYVTPGKQNYDKGFGGKNIFIESLTDNAKDNYEGNHPNVGDPIMIEEFGKEVRKTYT
jgi:hypothetical protein